jgi:hypothetical protein
MLFAVTLTFTLFMGIERALDPSDENRIINPMIGFALTLLMCSGFVRVHSVETHTVHGPVHIVHILLCVACLLYVRAMMGAIFAIFFFQAQ